MEIKILATNEKSGPCPKCRHIRADKVRVRYQDGTIRLHRWCDACKVIYGRALPANSVPDIDALPLREPWAATPAPAETQGGLF
jgi:hypothetical protein